MASMTSPHYNPLKKKRYQVDACHSPLHPFSILVQGCDINCWRYVQVFGCTNNNPSSFLRLKLIIYGKPYRLLNIEILIKLKWRYLLVWIQNRIFKSTLQKLLHILCWTEHNDFMKFFWDKNLWNFLKYGIIIILLKLDVSIVMYIKKNLILFLIW